MSQHGRTVCDQMHLGLLQTKPVPLQSAQILLPFFVYKVSVFFMLSKNGRLQFQIHILFHEGYNESEEGICPSSAGQSVIKCIWDCCRQSRLRARAKYSFLFCLRNKYLVVVSEKDILTIPKNRYNQL
jgi:hypothetical protein